MYSYIQVTSTTEEPTCESEQVSPDPGFAGSEFVTGSEWPLFDMHVTGSEVVPGLQRLLPAVMDTDECVFPPIPRLAQIKVFDGESLCRLKFSLETVT